MLSTTKSLGITGIDARVVDVEVDTVNGLPNFIIVGLPDSTIREARERIRSAVENSRFSFPPMNFIVNLAPADFKKQGANFDLPIAVSILKATGQIRDSVVNAAMVGELSLDGSVKPVRGVISMALNLLKAGYTEFIVPYGNRNEAASISGLSVYPVQSLEETVEVLRGLASPYIPEQAYEAENFKGIDFSEVRGQESAKRAVEIAAAGHHNVLFFGTPGSGKTMIARRISGILPPLGTDESIETSMIHSVSGEKPIEGLIKSPPFRAPHHTSSDVSLIGGGRFPGAGEISMAHNGVLFLDEFVEFKSNVLQALRQPLEDRIVTVSRAAGTITFPADFMLIAAANPCRCGYLFDKEIVCSCSPATVKSYFQKISGPILDRIDIEVMMNRVKYSDISSVRKEERSADIQKRVIEARRAQKDRFKGTDIKYNSRMNPGDVERFCPVDADCSRVLEKAINGLNLSARSYHKIIKVARTIADMEGSDSIKVNNILEAVSYKNSGRFEKN